jgi:hypothetical protein
MRSLDAASKEHIMPRNIILSGLLAVTATATAYGQVNSAATPSGATAAKPTKDKKVCHSETIVGSLVPKTTCHTKSEWDAIDAANRENAREAVNHLPPH